MDPPQDKDLLRYYNWLKETDGEGCGYEREVFALPENSADTVSGNEQHIIDICSPGIASKLRAR